MATDAVRFDAAASPTQALTVARTLLRDYGLPFGFSDPDAGLVQSDYAPLSTMQRATEGPNAPRSAVLDGTLVRLTIAAQPSGTGATVEVRATQRAAGASGLLSTPGTYWLDRYTAELADRLNAQYDERLPDAAYLDAIRSGTDNRAAVQQANAPAQVRGGKRGFFLTLGIVAVLFGLILTLGVD